MYSIVFLVYHVYVLQNIIKLIKQRSGFNTGATAQRPGYEIV